MTSFFVKKVQEDWQNDSVWFNRLFDLDYSNRLFCFCRGNRMKFKHDPNSTVLRMFSTDVDIRTQAV